MSLVFQHKGLGDPKHSFEVGSHLQSNHHLHYDLLRWLEEVVMGKLKGSLQQKGTAPSTQIQILVQQELNLVNIK
jgi:hypothetical protein